MTCIVLTLYFPRNECTVKSGSTLVLLCLDHPVQYPSTLAGTSLVASAHTLWLVGHRVMDVAFSHVHKLHFRLCVATLRDKVTHVCKVHVPVT